MNTTTDETKTALIGLNIDYIKKDIAEIKESLRDLGNTYVARTEFEELVKTVETIAQSNSLWRWLSPTFSAILSAVMTFLLISYLQHIVR